MRGAFSSCAMALVVALSSLVARAAPRRVVALPVRVQGELGEDWKRQLDRGVADGLARGEFDVVVTDARCSEPACFREIAAEHEARFVLRTTVTAEDRRYSIAITLLDGRSAEAIAEASDVCELCGMKEVREIVADQAAALRTKLDDLAAEPPILVVRSEPAEAVVRIDGAAVGTTPVRREVTPGTHIARAEKDGYVVVEREFLAVAGVEETLQLTLEPLPDIRPRFRPWGYIGIGVGGASIVTGVTFLVLDKRPAPGDRCRGGNIDPEGNCRFRWNTTAPGLVFTVAGAAVSLAGAAVLVAMRPHRSQRRRSSTWMPTGSGVVARF